MSEADALPAQASVPQAEAPPPLEERERDVLAELTREVDAWVSFQGLRRQLGVHQQALARTLRRLEAQGLVAHREKGYQVTEAGYSSLRGELARALDGRAGALGPRYATAPPKTVVPLVHALLPPHVTPASVERHLSRRWFGGLRWYGRSEAPGETSLHWIADGARVTVRVSSGSLALEVEGAGADLPGSSAEPFQAARPVLAALAELYGTGGSLVESSSRSAA